MKNPPACHSVAQHKLFDTEEHFPKNNTFDKHQENVKSDYFNYFSSYILNKKIRFLETDYVEKEMIAIFLKTSGLCPQ